MKAFKSLFIILAIFLGLAQTVGAQTDDCTSIKYEITKALAVYNYSHSDGPTMKVLDLSVLRSEDCLKNDAICPEGGNYQINSAGDVECSVHKIDQSTDEGQAKVCKKNRSKILGALEMYDMDKGGLEPTQGGRTIPADLSVLVNEEFLKSDPICPVGGVYNFDENLLVKCSVHGTTQESSEKQIPSDDEKEKKACQKCLSEVQFAIDTFNYWAGAHEEAEMKNLDLDALKNSGHTGSFMDNDPKCPIGGEYYMDERGYPKCTIHSKR